MWSRKGKADTAHRGDGMLVLTVEGMHCGSCGLTIDDAIEEVPGVSRATTSFRTGLSQVLLADGAERDAVVAQVLDAVAEAGYRAGVRPS